MTPRCLQCGSPLIPYEEISLCNICQYAEEPPARDEETISTLTLAELREMYGNPFGTEVHGDPFKKRRAA